MADVKKTASKGGITAGVSFTAVSIAGFVVAQVAPALEAHGIQMNEMAKAEMIAGLSGIMHGLYAAIQNIYKHWIARKK